MKEETIEITISLPRALAEELHAKLLLVDGEVKSDPARPNRRAQEPMFENGIDDWMKRIAAVNFLEACKAHGIGKEIHTATDNEVARLNIEREQQFTAAIAATSNITAKS